MKLLLVLTLVYGLAVSAQGTKIFVIFCGDYNVIMLQKKFLKKSEFSKIAQIFSIWLKVFFVFF